MAKRPGPKPKGARKEPPTGVRLPADLRQRLDEASAASKSTLSQEIIQRLDASFASKPRETGITPATLAVIEIVLAKIYETTGHHWHENAYAHRLAVEAIIAILHDLQPKGRPVVPDDHPALVWQKARNAKLSSARTAEHASQSRPIDLKALKQHLQDTHGASIGLEVLSDLEVAHSIQIQAGGVHMNAGHRRDLSLSNSLRPRLERLGRADAMERLIEYKEGKPPRKGK